MKHDSSSNASASDTTSRSGQSRAANKPAAPASEAEFLAEQAEQAKRALAVAFESLAKDLRDGVDPRGWAKEHPWASVAGAAVAGFAAAALLVPSKEEQALRRLAAMERALMPKTPAAQGPEDDGEDGGAKDFSRGRSGFLGAVGRQVLETIKPALMSALTAGITAKAATPDNPPADTPPPEAPDGDYGAARPGEYRSTPDPSASI